MTSSEPFACNGYKTRFILNPWYWIFNGSIISLIYLWFWILTLFSSPPSGLLYPWSWSKQPKASCRGVWFWMGNAAPSSPGCILWAVPTRTFHIYGSDLDPWVFFFAKAAYTELRINLFCFHVNRYWRWSTIRTTYTGWWLYVQYHSWLL